SSIEQDTRIAHVVLDERAHLHLAVRGIKRLRRALDDVGDAVELRRLPAKPERMQGLLFAGCCRRHKRLRHHDESASCTGEASALRITAELDRALTRARDFVDRMRD